jgi:elongation factor 1-delta
MEVFYTKINVWLDKPLYDKAETLYYEKLAKSTPQKKTSLAGEVAKARERIKQSLENVDDLKLSDSASSNDQKRIDIVEKDLNELKLTVNRIEKKLDEWIGKLSISVNTPKESTGTCKKPEPPKAPSSAADDDDVDLFGSESEDEDEEAKKIKEQRVAAYAAKKSKKPVLIAKSNIILDVKPWDDETDMKELEKEVRKVTMDGLVWGASKLVPLAYGIHKLQISCVVEDDKVSVDELQEKLQEIEEYVSYRTVLKRFKQLLPIKTCMPR